MVNRSPESKANLERPVSTQVKSRVFSRRNLLRAAAATVFLGATTYATLSVREPFNRKEFTSEEELLEAMNQALGTKIDWQHVHVAAELALQHQEVALETTDQVRQVIHGTVVIRPKKSPEEIESERLEAHRWVREDALDWGCNFQNKHAQEKDCNDHSVCPADALHDAGIEVLYVSLTPALEQDSYCSKHQVAVVKIHEMQFAVFDNSKCIMVHGSLEEYFLTKDRPMQILQLGNLGVAKARKPYFDNFAGRGVMLLNNRVQLSQVEPVITQPNIHYSVASN